MHDIKFIRENPEAFDAGIVNRGGEPFADILLEQDEHRREALTALQELQSAINLASKLAGEARARGDAKEFERLSAIKKEKKPTLDAAEELAKEKEASWIKLLLNIPNTPMENVPIGKDEEDNKERHRWGTIPSFSYPPKEHFNIPSVSKGMDFETAGNISGSRFVILSGAIARVHRALAQFMLDLHINEHDLVEINAPVIVNDDALFGTGQLPKFAEDCYKIHSDNEGVENATDQWLIPTSEVSLTNIVAGKILNKDQLPIRYCAHSLCFRKEAGSAGRDTAGMLRHTNLKKWKWCQ